MPADSSPPKKTSTLRSLIDSMKSWRTACVTLQSFSSGLPLGLVIIAVPAWLKMVGFDNTTIGWVSAAQVPYAFKFIWSPLLDRYAPPFLGRKRGWAVIAQLGLLLATLALAFAAGSPHRIGVIWACVFLIAFASATQDIAVDAYAVEVLHPEEQGVAAGARSAMSRLALTLSGRMAIGASKRVAWPILFAVQSVVYLPAALLMVFSPEPDSPPSPPRSLREAVWEPILDFLRQHRAVEIATFLVLYKFGDNLASALVSPFLLDKGYTALDVGPLFFWLGFAGSILGALAGGAITSGVGLGHALWLFGFLQAFSNLGYILLAQTGVNRPLMCGAMFFESATTGMGTGAFSVLLLRLTQKRFSATQYALLSSIFALGRTASGPLAGVLSDALGWTVFFALTIVAAVPGLVMLQRFVPLGTREPTFGLEEREAAVAHADLGPPRSLARRALTGAAGGLVFGLLYGACLNALKGMRSSPGGRFDLGAALQRYFAPSAPGDWIGLIGVLIFAVVCGLVAVAFAAARREGRNVRA